MGATGGGDLRLKCGCGKQQQLAGSVQAQWPTDMAHHSSSAGHWVVCFVRR
jgi:hypothetical protein